MHWKKYGQQFLTVYSTILSTAVIVMLLTGARAHRKQSVDEIDVQRINVVEPDGTLRMVISDKSRLPPVIIKGKEQKMGEPRPQAGMLFYNDEGSENGGLIFGGHMNEKGEVVDSGGSLSFDKYGSSGQLVQLAGVDDKADRFAGLAVNGKKRRVWVGTTDDKTASVALMDARGRKRLLLEVPDEGTPSISFLDDNGQVIRRISAN